MILERDDWRALGREVALAWCIPARCPHTGNLSFDTYDNPIDGSRQYKLVHGDAAILFNLSLKSLLFSDLEDVVGAQLRIWMAEYHREMLYAVRHPHAADIPEDALIALNQE